ncbi:MAG: hypothetical protein AABZ47_16895, partial [Planctomycetota bacterium]
VLERPIAAGGWTAISYLGASEECGTVTFGSLPGDVDGNGSSHPQDTLALGDILTGAGQPVFGEYSTDIDHNGALAIFDLLRQTDLLVGAGTFIPWLERAIPSRNCHNDQSPLSAPLYPPAEITAACMLMVGEAPVHLPTTGDPDPADVVAYLDLLRAACLVPANDTPPSNPDEDPLQPHRRAPVVALPEE